MNTTFHRLYRNLGRVVLGMLLVALAFFALSLLFALLGFSHVVASFGGVALATAYVFVALLGLFLVTSIVAAVVRLLDRRQAARQRA